MSTKKQIRDKKKYAELVETVYRAERFGHILVMNEIINRHELRAKQEIIDLYNKKQRERDRNLPYAITYKRRCWLRHDTLQVWLRKKDMPSSEIQKTLEILWQQKD